MRTVYGGRFRQVGRDPYFFAAAKMRDLHSLVVKNSTGHVPAAEKAKY